MAARLFDEPRSFDRLQPSADVSAERTRSLLNELCDVAKRVDELDSAELGLEARGTQAAAEVGSLLQRAVQCLQLLEALDMGSNDDDSFGFEVEPTTLAAVPVDGRASPRLADVCFAGAIELNRALQELLRARADDDVLVALETALRKLRRALRAVLDTSLLRRDTEPIDAEQLRWQGAFDLESTLFVRRLYADFRRSLRRPQGETTDAILTALRYAAGGLATLISSPNYGRARVADRHLLRRLQQRLLLWAHGERSVKPGLELLDDVWTCADLLRDISRRQELKVHDLSLLRQLSAGPLDASEQWLGQLAPLYGLDDALDQLVEQQRLKPCHDTVREIQARLAALSRDG
jgi:hypothetical protein